MKIAAADRAPDARISEPSEPLLLHALVNLLTRNAMRVNPEVTIDGKNPATDFTDYTD